MLKPGYNFSRRWNEKIFKNWKIALVAAAKDSRLVIASPNYAVQKCLTIHITFLKVNPKG